MSLTSRRPISADEFARMPETPDGSREELVKGAIVTVSPPPKFDHGFIQAAIVMLLGRHLAVSPTGRVTTESGVVTEHDPDTVRGPDVAYWSYARVPKDVPIETYPDAAPDLCVEILSTGERYGRVQQKLGEYLARGVRAVWVVDPADRSVTVHRAGALPAVRGEADELTGDDALPGFKCGVREVFEQ
jgi:Uma2 family endonuclease